MKKILKIIPILIISLCIFISPVFADSDDDEGGGLFVLLLAGPAYYAGMSAFYSGKDKHHAHEQETEASIENIVSNDAFIKTEKGKTQKSLNTYYTSNYER